MYVCLYVCMYVCMLVRLMYVYVWFLHVEILANFAFVKPNS